MANRITRRFERPLRMAALVLSVLGVSLTALTTQPGCPLKSCSEVGCLSRVTGTLEVRLSPQDLSGTRLEMCHAPSTGDPHCAVSELRWHLDALSCGTRLSDRRNAVTFDTSPRVSSEGVSLSPTYYPGAGEEFADGDRFTIRLLDPSESTVLAETSGTVAHFAVTSTPACQGDEPVCRSGSF